MRLAIMAGLLCAVSSAQYWDGPYQLSSDPASDINPSGCREWVASEWTCLAWQTDRNGNWDVHARFCRGENGSGWEDELAVSDDPLDEIYPVVACVADTWYRPTFWCAWERRDEPGFGSIMAARSWGADSWQEPVCIGQVAYGPGDTAKPSIIYVRGETRDSIWVVWRTISALGHAIVGTCFDGDTWCDAQVIYNDTARSRDIRIGRATVPHQGYAPFVVWERNGDILYTWYDGLQWADPDTIASSPARDWNPELISQCYVDMMGWPWLWVTWESERDGDTAVYVTPTDSLHSARRFCDTTNAGVNLRPCGTYAIFTTDWLPAAVAWQTDRNGNWDIYSNVWNYQDEWVDLDPAQDVNPTMTTIGPFVGSIILWACWQSNRDGNWDIYGSFIYGSGVEDRDEGERVKAVQNVPTIARGVLNLTSDFTVLPSGFVLLDLSGRRVMDLRPGPNDIRHLPPGIYFLRSGNGMQTAKVVVQR